jgi:hypothetical protein
MSRVRTYPAKETETIFWGDLLAGRAQRLDRSIVLDNCEPHDFTPARGSFTQRANDPQCGQYAWPVSYK